MFVEKFTSLDSTSSYVKTHLKRLPNKGYVVTETQTAGHGQFGRSFTSPLGGIYMTLFFPWPKTIPLPREMSLDAARLVKQILLKHASVPIELKWPNDLFIGNKKMGGILTEIVDQVILIGIGLNINTQEGALQEINQPATSLFIETGKLYDLPPLIGEIAETLIQALQKE